MRWSSLRCIGAVSCAWLALTAGPAGQTPSRAQAPPAPMPTLALTTLEERALAPDLDNRTLSFTFAQPIGVKDLLPLLVRGTTLSLVAEPSVGGTFVGELKNVTIRQALHAVLPPLGLEYRVDGTVVTIRRRAPETRLFDVNYIATSRTASSRVGGAASSASFASVTSTTGSDVFADIGGSVRALLSDQGRFSVDRKAGLLQVTDFPERLDRVGVYLDAVLDRVHRQVEIAARLVDVDLRDGKAIDWSALGAALAAAPIPAAANTPVRGLRITDPDRFLTALAGQGRLTVLRTDRFTALNNEAAMLKTDGLTLSVTAQIAPAGVLMLSVTPIVGGDAGAESDVLARVADGESIVVSGFGRDRVTRARKNTGLSGGWFGRTTVETHAHVESLVLLTPRIVAAPSDR